MIIGYITHEETTIKSFMEDSEFADYLMSEILKDGDEKEITHFQNLYDEARSRMMPEAVNA